MTKVDSDYHRKSGNSRYNPLPSDSTPIWARHRVSHSTVKPSDLVREYDKKEKLEAKAFRRLSRTGIK
jgi:hypothetical protein